MEALLIQCTTCKARLRVTDPALIGQIQECPKCGSMVLVTPPPGTNMAPAITAGGVIPQAIPKAFDSRDTVLEGSSSSSVELPPTSAGQSPVVPPPVSPPKLPLRQSTNAASSMAAQKPQPVIAPITATKPVSATVAKKFPGGALETHWLLAASAVMLVLVAVVLGSIMRSGGNASPAQPTETQTTSDPDPEVAKTESPDTASEATLAAPPIQDAHQEPSPQPRVKDVNVVDIPPPLPQLASPLPAETEKLAPAENKASETIIDAAIGDNKTLPKPDKVETPDAKPNEPADDNAQASRKAEIERQLQEKVIKVRYEKVELAKFLAELGDLSGVTFRLDDKLPKRAKQSPVSVRLSETTFAGVLESALGPIGLRYEVTKDRVLILAK